MHKRVSLILRLAASVLVFSGYLALGSVRLYGPGLLLIPLVLLPLSPVGAYLERNWRIWGILRRTAAIVYIVFIPFSLQLFGLMDAVILLIIFIQTYLLLGTKNARVYYELFLMSFFLLLAAVVQDPESMIAIALLLFSVSAVWAFATLRMHIEITERPRLTIPEMASLEKDAARPIVGNVFDLGLVLSLGTLSVISILLTAIVFLLTPRIEAGWLGRRDSGQSVTGLSETVRIMGSTTISEDPSVVMHVRFPDERPDVPISDNLLYWRVTTLPRFSSDEWSRRGLQNHYEPGVSGALANAGRGWGASLQETKRNQRPNSRVVRQVIYMDNVPTTGMPCLDLPYGLRIQSESPSARVHWDAGEDFTLILDTRGTRSLQYESASDIVSRGEESLRAAPFDYSYMAARDFSMLTYHGLLPETQQLARSLTDALPSPYDKVKALETWLSSAEFTYTLDVPPLPPQNSIDAFITTLKRGHCELYASALALMTRSLGIPSRVVSGYRGGDYNPTDEAYLVRASMAHLWVEVLFNNVGWVRFDPSPRSDFSLTGLGRVRMAWSNYVLRAKMFWFQRVVGFRGGLRLDQILRIRPWNLLPRGPHAGQAADGQQAAEVVKSFSYWNFAEHPATRIVAAASILAGITFIWKRRRKRGRGAYPLTRDQARVRSLYLRFIKKAGAMGIDCENKSAGEIWELLGETQASGKEGIGEFLRTYHQVRFGGRPLDAPLQQEAKRQISELKIAKKTE